MAGVNSMQMPQPINKNDTKTNPVNTNDGVCFCIRLSDEVIAMQWAIP